jgi:ATP-binding cassette subfamily B protein RaxB
VTPRICLHNVSFSHSSNLPPTLRDISLTIEFGESICITGPSGCGKSTLARILLGLCDPGDGEIRVNEASAGDYGLDAYRSLFGAVMQDDVLFAGTIEQNVHFFDPEPDLLWAHECSKMVGIHDEILAMPMKYRTLIGDLGTGLSGGQKQRLFIARALYRWPRILVLDEATSHLDIDGERLVNEAIDLAAVTRIMIAHRPETIASARRVLRLENGSIVEDRVNRA